MRVEDLSWIKEMIWSEKDALEHQRNQLSVSENGATAVVNTLVSMVI